MQLFFRSQLPARATRLLSRRLQNTTTSPQHSQNGSDSPRSMDGHQNRMTTPPKASLREHLKQRQQLNLQLLNSSSEDLVMDKTLRNSMLQDVSGFKKQLVQLRRILQEVSKSIWIGTWEHFVCENEHETRHFYVLCYFFANWTSIFCYFLLFLCLNTWNKTFRCFVCDLFCVDFSQFVFGFDLCMWPNSLRMKIIWWGYVKFLCLTRRWKSWVLDIWNITCPTWDSHPNSLLNCFYVTNSWTKNMKN